MSELVGDLRVRNLLILVFVTLVHTALFALVLNARFRLPVHPERPALNIEIAELEPERPPEPGPEPSPEPDPPPTREASVPLPAPVLKPAPPQPEPTGSPEPPLSGDAAPQKPAVLTQLDPVQTATEALAEGQTNTIGTAETTKVLQQFSCLKLTGRPDETCPKPDPFEVAEALQRQAEARLDPMPVLVFNAQNSVERFLSKQDGTPHMFPGMDADLFSDPLPTGSHNAARIRNGQAPIWDRDLEETLRRQND